MRKTFLVCVFIFLFPFLVFAQGMQPTGGVTASAAACATVYRENTTSNGELTGGSGNERYYRGLYFVTGAAATICKVTVKLTSYGTITGKTYTARFWTLTGLDLAAEIGTSTGVTGASWSGTTVTFLFPTPVSLSTATTYVLSIDQGGVDVSNYFSIAYNTVDVLAVPVWSYGRWSNLKAYTDMGAGDPVMSLFTQ